MRDVEKLRGIFRRIDGKGFRAYKELTGSYKLRDFTLYVDHVQPDPFAGPSRLRVRLSAKQAGFPTWATESAERRVALADFLTRTFHRAAEPEDPIQGGRQKPRGPQIGIEAPRQEIYERNSVVVRRDGIEARITVDLPGRGRRIQGKQAKVLLMDGLTKIVKASLRFEALDSTALHCHLEAMEDQEALRSGLEEHEIVAFVGDGSLLPRQSGTVPLPLRHGAVRFESPASLAVELAAPNLGMVRGMGIPPGVTLIVGGGYHGKSTLLEAIELGIYNHVPEDGRDLVVTRPDAVKIRAESGRRVEKVDISPFIDDLPFGGDTSAFSTDNASGSTSQAAAIVEAVEAGAKLLLIDEDTSATNFLIRDHRMQALVSKEKEPITPFIDRVRQLYDEHGVSTILVVGSVGDYFDVADTVILMDEYTAKDATEDARRVASELPGTRAAESNGGFGEIEDRAIRFHQPEEEDGQRRERLDSRGLHTLLTGNGALDLSALEQLAEPAQTRTIARAVALAQQKLQDGEMSLGEVLDRLERIQEDSLDSLARGNEGNLARVRRFELAAALNRLHSLWVSL